MLKLNKRNAIVAARVQRTAEIHGITKRHVYRIISGDHKNEPVMMTYMDLCEGERTLVEAVKKLALEGL